MENSTVVSLNEKATEIHWDVRSGVQRIYDAKELLTKSEKLHTSAQIEAGEKLVEAKQLLPHGHFEKYLKDFKISKGTAHRYCKAAKYKKQLEEMEMFNVELLADGMNSFLRVAEQKLLIEKEKKYDPVEDQFARKLKALLDDHCFKSIVEDWTHVEVALGDHFFGNVNEEYDHDDDDDEAFAEYWENFTTPNGRQNAATMYLHYTRLKKLNNLIAEKLSLWLDREEAEKAKRA